MATATDHAARWQDRVYCMIAPDALRRQLGRPILARFAKAGLAPVGWRLTPVTSLQIDRMSEHQRVGVGSVYRYRALDALFALGPALSVVLADTWSRPVPELYAMVKEMKGNADPYRAAPDTIRHDLRAVNTVLSLLHTSDSPTDSATECAILTGEADPDAFDATGDVASFIAMLEASQPAERRDFAEVLAGVRGRVLALLWSELAADGRHLATRLAAEGGLAEPQVGAILAEHVTDGLPPALTALLRTPFDGGEPRVDLVGTRLQLAACGLELDAWELAVLTTSSYFRPAR
jgi:nucleoside diphosphate kinase